MKPVHFITILVVIFVAWASLFITVLDQSGRTHELLKNDRTLLKKDTDIINGQTKTINILNNKFDNLQKHDDCLFNLATRPNPAYIADPSTCTIFSAQGTPSSSSKASAPLSSPKSSSSPQSAPSSSKTQAENPAPKPSLIQQLLNKL